MNEKLTGRELDAAVARVLGWTDIYIELDDTGNCEILTGVVPSDSYGGLRIEIPHYSTDPALALGLLDVLGRDYLWPNIDCSDGVKWTVAVINPRNSKPNAFEFIAENISLIPEQICRAFLAAKS